MCNETLRTFVNLFTVADGRPDPIALSRAAAERCSGDHLRPMGAPLSILDRKLTGMSDPGSPGVSDSRLLLPMRSRHDHFFSH